MSTTTVGVFDARYMFDPGSAVMLEARNNPPRTQADRSAIARSWGQCVVVDLDQPDKWLEITADGGIGTVSNPDCTEAEEGETDE